MVGRVSSPVVAVCRALDSGIIPDASAKQYSTIAGSFAQTAEAVCATPLAEIHKRYPAVSDADSRFLCLDLSLQSALLTKGLKIPEQKELTLVKQLRYQGEWFEAAWPLGAAINTCAEIDAITNGGDV
jgi:apyrase